MFAQASQLAAVCGSRAEAHRVAKCCSREFPLAATRRAEIGRGSRGRFGQRGAQQAAGLSLAWLGSAFLFPLYLAIRDTAWPTGFDERASVRVNE